MKLLQKRSVAVTVMIAAIVTGIVFGQLRKPDPADQASTAVVGTYTYVYDHAHVLTDETMAYLDAMEHLPLRPNRSADHGGNGRLHQRRGHH